MSAGDSRSIALPSGPFSLERVRIMGIVNRTPDSFYGHARYEDVDHALAGVRSMIDEGVDMVDVGGEKAGPGPLISTQEELDRVIPLVEAIRRESAIPISIDTLKPDVARAAMVAGADVINSIGGFADPGMTRVAVETEATIVIMHIKGEPRVANPSPSYEDVGREVRDALIERACLCVASGVDPSRIIIDPGPGFGKTAAQDLALLRELPRLTALPYPVLLAISRKRFIGDMLAMPVEDRLEGSLAVTSWGVLHGVRIVRTHDVMETKRVCAMTEAILWPELVEVAAS